jgi:hypothetical protein
MNDTVSQPIPLFSSVRVDLSGRVYYFPPDAGLSCNYGVHLPAYVPLNKPGQCEVIVTFDIVLIVNHVNYTKSEKEIVLVSQDVSIGTVKEFGPLKLTRTLKRRSESLHMHLKSLNQYILDQIVTAGGVSRDQILAELARLQKPTRPKRPK